MEHSGSFSAVHAWSATFNKLLLVPCFQREQVTIEKTAVLIRLSPSEKHMGPQQEPLHLSNLLIVILLCCVPDLFCWYCRQWKEQPDADPVQTH